MRAHRLIGRLAFGAGLVLGFLGLFAPGADPATVLAHAEQELVIVRSQAAPGEPETQKVIIKLIQVIPRTGNNPLNPQEPINNRDGQVVTEPAFTPQSASYGQPAPGIGAASLARAANGQWTLQSGDPRSADAIVIQLSPGAPGVVSVHPSVRNSNFSIVGGNPFIQFPADGQTRMFDARHLPTGAVYRVRFQADTALTGKVTVASVVRL